MLLVKHYFQICLHFQKLSELKILKNPPYISFKCTTYFIYKGPHTFINMTGDMPTLASWLIFKTSWDQVCKTRTRQRRQQSKQTAIVAQQRPCNATKRSRALAQIAAHAGTKLPTTAPQKPCSTKSWLDCQGKQIFHTHLCRSGCLETDTRPVSSRLDDSSKTDKCST